jgi:hypothetical protein
MITSNIASGNGEDYRLKVYPEGEIGAVIHTHPPLNESFTALPFRAYFESTIDNNMIVDGSTLGVDKTEFKIKADDNFDYWIKSISIKLADANAVLNKFGNLTALTNGVSFFRRNQSQGELTIHDGIKDNLEWFRLSKQAPAIVDLSGGGADAVIVDIDLAELFGGSWGLSLKKGTTDELVFKVNDALAGLDEFNIIGYGIKI